MKRCINGKCRIQPEKARYYKSTNMKRDIILHGITYGDIIKKGERLYILDKTLRPRALRRDKCKNYIIPEKYRKDLGHKYWSRIPGLKTRKIEDMTVCELRQLAYKKEIPQSGTKAELISRLQGSGRCYESMSKAQLLERATKRGILYRHSMNKYELINALRK